MAILTHVIHSSHSLHIKLTAKHKQHEIEQHPYLVDMGTVGVLLSAEHDVHGAVVGQLHIVVVRTRVHDRLVRDLTAQKKNKRKEISIL